MTTTELVVGGIPLLSVKGTPRASGEAIGLRYKSHLQQLAQDISERIADSWLNRQQPCSIDLVDPRHALQPGIAAIRSLEPAAWMELESIASVSGLAPHDLLLVHGWSDLLNYFRVQRQVATRSTFVALTGQHTDHGGPRAVFAWHLDPALMPYITLVHRIPTHGPATLSLTVAGVHPVAGLSEGGLCVAMNTLAVDDGAPGYFTTTLVTAALAAPDWDSARRRLEAAPRYGGACLHLMEARGARCSLEVSGRQHAVLSDPWPSQVPRVHCNGALAPSMRRISSHDGDDTSRARMARFAALAVDVRGSTPSDIARWFRLGDSGAAAASGSDDGIDPLNTIIMICDPAQKRVHVLRGGLQAAPGTATL